MVAPAMRRSSTNALVVFITTADERQAIRISKIVVKAKFAACANVLPNIRSVYRWKGKVIEEGEVLVMLKTREDRYHALEKSIKGLHSYKVPEVIAVPITRGSQQYLGWLFSETNK